MIIYNIVRLRDMSRITCHFLCVLFSCYQRPFILSCLIFTVNYIIYTMRYINTVLCAATWRCITLHFYTFYTISHSVYTCSILICCMQTVC